MISAVSKQDVNKRNTLYSSKYYHKRNIEELLHKKPILLRIKSSMQHQNIKNRIVFSPSKLVPVKPTKASIPKIGKNRMLWAAVAIIALLAFLILLINAISWYITIDKGIAIPEESAYQEAFSNYIYSHDVLSSINVSGKPEQEEISTLKINYYTVKTGDSLSGIAQKFKLNIDTIVSYNNIKSVKLIVPGLELAIPSIDGIEYKVKPGDTLSGIAKRFGISLNDVLDWNNIDSALIMVGNEYFIPKARMNKNDLNKVLGHLFVYPTSAGLSSNFGWRNDPFSGVKRYHNGIDLANLTGTPVYASMDGTVINVGYNAVYGKYIILGHNDNFQTLYGHLDKVLVVYGQYIYQWNKIGEIGNTGYSTGSHLHFSIFKNGAPVDPLIYLN